MTSPQDPRLRLAMRGWPQDLLDEWEERAAIIEYDGNQKRIIAEQRAYEELKQAQRKP